MLWGTTNSSYDWSLGAGSDNTTFGETHSFSETAGREGQSHIAAPPRSDSKASAGNHCPPRTCAPKVQDHVI